MFGYRQMRAWHQPLVRASLITPVVTIVLAERPTATAAGRVDSGQEPFGVLASVPVVECAESRKTAARVGGWPATAVALVDDCRVPRASQDWSPVAGRTVGFRVLVIYDVVRDGKSVAGKQEVRF